MNHTISFWSSEMETYRRNAHQRLINNPDHELVRIAANYDLIRFETLKKFGVGIVEKNGTDWLLFPYETGAQLYRRDDDKKRIMSLIGSKPNQSFFTASDQTCKTGLVIAKSPRETMLLNQFIGASHCIIGLCSGELPHFSEEQEAYLKQHFTTNQSCYVLLDTDTSEALKTSISLTTNTSIIMKNTAKYLDISSESGDKYKDITDAARDGKGKDYVSELMQNAKMPTVQTGLKESCDSNLDTTSQLPKSIYDDLPLMLKTLIELIDEDYRKDVFLLGALVVIASHLKNVFFDHVDRLYTPDFFMLIIAKAASGKGFASKCKKLGSKLNNFLLSRLNKDDDVSKGNIVDRERPGNSRGLFLPANSSDRALYDSLNSNNGRGIIFETEIDTLLKANTQDWGDFTEVLRKAFHHEDLSISRKEDFFAVKEPALSILLTGTHDQFRNLFRNVENGFYSRFSIYTFDSPFEWRSQKPTKEGQLLNVEIERVSDQLLDLYLTLSSRHERLIICFSDKQWAALNDTFSQLFDTHLDQNSPSALVSSLKRSAIVAFRMATILTVIRTYEEDPDLLRYEEKIYAEDQDVEIALKIVQTNLEHSFYLYFNEIEANKLKASEFKVRMLLNKLPDKFTTSEAVQVGVDVDYSERSVKRKLNELQENGLIEKMSHGTYSKL